MIIDMTSGSGAQLPTAWNGSVWTWCVLPPPGGIFVTGPDEYLGSDDENDKAITRRQTVVTTGDGDDAMDTFFTEVEEYTVGYDHDGVAIIIMRRRSGITT